MTIKTNTRKIGRMMDGKDYIESLRDGRTVFLNGEKIDDVTKHPAYQNSIRSMARLYDALHDDQTSSILTRKTKEGFTTQKFFTASESAAELLEARDAIAEWSKLSYGFMGRTPDYKAAFTAHLGPYANFYKGFEDNARHWYEKTVREVPFCNHTIINPQMDRSKPLHENKDVFVRVVKERDDGIIVSGAKMVGTSAAITNYNFVANYSPVDLVEDDLDHALIFFVDMNADGLKIISRQSYEFAAAMTGSPYDYPLSSRFDENDAVIVLDNVFVPWENVFAYRDVEITNGFRAKTGWMNRYTLHGCTRFAVKLDFMSGLLMKATEMSGTNKFRGVQASIGQVIAWRNTFWALSTSMAADPIQGENGVVLPNLEALGVSYTIFASFDEVYASREVQDFIDELSNINPREIWVGPAFHFGKKKSGTIQDLNKAFKAYQHPVVTCPKGEVISSTRIRQLFQHEQIEQANDLLGRHQLVINS